MKSDQSAQILRSTGIIGGAAAINVVLGLVRIKAAALILGPAGIGLIGLFHNLITLAASFAAFGIGNVGTRQIAEAGDDAPVAAAARLAMTLAAIALSLAGGFALFLLRDGVATVALGRPDWSDEVGWLAIGVTLLVLATFQNGLLTGLRRIGDVARVSVWSAVIGTLLGIAVLLVWRDRALLPFVILSPLATFLVGAWFVARVPKSAAPRPSRADLTPHWRALIRLGFAFSLGAIALTAGQFGVRTLIQRDLGSVPLGHFQAAWVISANYIGFILAAMATDYYPRLTGVIKDHAAAVRTVNQQAEVALLLAGPILVGAIGLAPWLIPLLYSGEFLPAVAVLRWQILGDFFKIAVWSLGFILLAAGNGRAFVAVEVGAASVLVAATALLLPAFGLEAAGLAYLAMNALALPVLYLLARRSIGFVPARATVEAFVAVAVALMATALASLAAPIAGAATAAISGTALAGLAMHRLGHALPEPFAGMIASVGRKLRRR